MVNSFVQFRHHYKTNTIKSWGNNIINQEGLIKYQYYCKPTFIRMWEIFVRFQELRIFLTVDLYLLYSCNTKTGVDKACSRKLIAMSQFILCKSLKKVMNNSWFTVFISTNMFQWFNHQLKIVLFFLHANSQCFFIDADTKFVLLCKKMGEKNLSIKS